MVREIHAKEAGGLTDIVTLHEQVLGLVDNIIVDIPNSRAACCLMDNIAKVAR